MANINFDLANIFFLLQVVTAQRHARAATDFAMSARMVETTLHLSHTQIHFIILTILKRPRDHFNFLLELNIKP